MKIVIVGAGAMGTLFTAFLAKKISYSGASRTREKTFLPDEVILLDKHPQRVKIIERKGIKVTGVSRLQVTGRRFQVTSEPKEIGVADLVIIFVKAYDTEEVAKKIKPVVGRDTYLLTLQNGLNNLETLSKFFDKEKILGGTTGQGVTYLGPGEVFHAGRGETIIGAMSKESRPCVQERDKLRAKSEEISEIFNRAGIETKITDNLESAIWSKLVLNSAINPLAALSRRKNGELIKEKKLKNLLCAVAQETSKIAQAKGIKLLYPNPEKKVVESCQATAKNVNSMLQDVLNGKRTEIDFINGAIVREGRKIGQPTPLNEICWILVKSLKGGISSSSRNFS